MRPQQSKDGAEMVGQAKAAKNASAAGPAPRIAARMMSRTKPVSRDNRVKPSTVRMRLIIDPHREISLINPAAPSASVGGRAAQNQPPCGPRTLSWFRPRSLGALVDFLVFDAAPQSPHQDVVARGSLGVHAGRDTVTGERTGEGLACELGPLVSIEDASRPLSRPMNNSCWTGRYRHDSASLVTERSLSDR